ncbi:MAG: PAS domain S-box protein, partial [Methanomicrobiales archaeon]|nr:PAS domain S-box protein [Methanomicrobiales archaeon]
MVWDPDACQIAIPMDPVIAILSFCSLVSAFITFGLGIAVFLRNTGSKTNRLFLLAMITATCWGFCEFMIWQAATAESVGFWLRASSAWPFVVAFILHFILSLTETPLYRNYPRLILTAIYLPAAAITCILLFTDWIYTVDYLPRTGFFYIPVRDSLWYQAETLYTLFLMLYAAYVISLFWKSAPSKIIKKQAKLLLAAIGIVIVFGFFSGILLPLIGVAVPNLVFIGIVLFSFCITMAIWKHELFVLSSATAVPDILRTMPDAMILADMQGRIISSNDSANTMFGLRDSTLEGKTVADCLLDPAFDRIRTAVRDEGRVIDMETGSRKNPSATLSIAGSQVLDPAGEPAGVVLIIRDITDRKTVEKALRIAGEKISLLTRITRHDINNLISALSGYLVLLDENPDDPERAVYITSSLEIVEKIGLHLQFTHEYQEIGANQPVWQPLREIISRATADLPSERPLIESAAENVGILADPLTVKVIYNLLENAIRHGEHLTRISVSTREQADHSLLLVIEDDGVGIP